VKVVSLQEQAARAGVEVTDIGRMLAGAEETRFLDRQGKPRAFARPSFSHF
jgi:hypothetical protein